MERRLGGEHRSVNEDPRIIPQQPLEDNETPVLVSCLTQQEVSILSPNSREAYPKVVDLLAKDNPSQAYIEITTKDRKILDHHAPGWGCVYYAISIPAIEPGVFSEPVPGSVRFVAIKKLNIEVVDHAISQGKKENPYKEIRRMQMVGDNKHVLGCIEALRDQHYIYIVMPYCEEESLVDWIPWKQGLPEWKARTLFLQVLENILYLRSHGICHRDLSPDNCMVYRGRVVFTDLAMSFRIPPSGIVVPLGGFGKPAYLPPEVFFNLPFDGYACDLWSSAIILFNLLTGEILYQYPEPGNIMFRYFILAGGLSNTPINERTVEVLLEVEEADKHTLQCIAEKCMALSPAVLELLEGMLRVASRDRWTVDDVKRSTWIGERSD